MKKLAFACASLLISTVLAWADPSGTYDVAGTELDGKAYQGTLEVVKSGDVFTLNYTFSDGTQQEGSAIGDDTFLAYGYGDDEELGVGLMTAKGPNWEGVWTHVGASTMSLETWTRK